MKITNKNNIPSSLYSVLKTNTYNRKREPKLFSVTQILNSPKYIFLKREYYNEIEVDASERIWLLIGNAVHDFIEKHNKTNSIKEERLKAKVDYKDYEITGKSDCLINENGQNIIEDYKTTSVWSIIYKSNYEKWEQQLNIYAWLYEKIGFKIDKLRIVAILKDWNVNDKRKSNYPDYPIKTIYFKKWDTEKVEEFLFNRFRLIDKYINTPVNEIPACSDENRYYTGDEYALHRPLKSGNGYRKRASRVMSDKQKLLKWAEKRNIEDYKIEYREGINKKCLKYCDVNKFCNFYNEKVKDDNDG